MSQQANWRYCKKCGGLFFAGKNAGFVGNSPGVCPAGGAHDDSTSGAYILSVLSGSGADQPGQAGWKWCSKCQGLFLPTRLGSTHIPDLGVCPAGGQHAETRATDDYVLPEKQPNALPNPFQPGWTLCSLCQGLFFPGPSAAHPSLLNGVCPSKGQHGKLRSHIPGGTGPYFVAQVGSNFNLVLSDNGNNLTDVSVTIVITQDMICTSESVQAGNPGGVPPVGFSFQLNAYSPITQGAVGWQQYVIALVGNQLSSVINNWFPIGGNYFVLTWSNLCVVPGLVAGTIPAGYILTISLQTDDNTDAVTGATFTVVDNQGTRTSQFLDLTTLTLAAAGQSGPLTPANLAPIVAFELDVVGTPSSGISTLTSGAGTITCRAANILSASESVPTNASASTTFTNETANTYYGVLPSGLSDTFTQSFNVTDDGALAPPPPPPPQPPAHLDFEPTSNETGYFFTWSGTGFPAGAFVSLFLVGLAGRTASLSAGGSTADANGNISGEFTYTFKSEVRSSPTVSLQAQIDDTIFASSTTSFALST